MNLYFVMFVVCLMHTGICQSNLSSAHYYITLLYNDALELTGLPTLLNRREAIAANLFDEICANPAHSLRKLLPDKCTSTNPLRNQRTLIALIQ